MREAEAKTKWCPFVRHGSTDTSTFNRGYAPGDAINAGRADDGYRCTCIGSGCMMWRWTTAFERPQTSDHPRQGWAFVPASDSDDGREYYVEPQKEANTRRHGGCGLAGVITP